jgi:hypothetical protein
VVLPTSISRLRCSSAWVCRNRRISLAVGPNGTPNDCGLLSMISSPGSTMSEQVSPSVWRVRSHFCSGGSALWGSERNDQPENWMPSLPDGLA